MMSLSRLVGRSLVAVALWACLVGAMSLAGHSPSYVKRWQSRLLPRPSAPAQAVAPKIAVAATAVSSAKEAAAPAADESLHLLLPKSIYAVPGVECCLYFDNVIQTQHFDMFRFKVECAVGRAERRRWVHVPSAKDVGRHRLVVTVADHKGKELARSETTLCIAPAEGGAGGRLRLFFVGDSYVHETHHVNAVAELLNRPKNPTWTMLGTNRTPQAAPGVRHEGYGGWTWNDFLTHDEPGSAKRRYRERSPFLYPSSKGGVELDVARYIREECGGVPPDVTIFEVGVNDMFCSDPDQPVALEARITEVLQQAETLIAAFRKAAPATTIGVWTAPPLTHFEGTYPVLYGPAFPKWRLKRTLHRYQERLLQHFADREKSENLYVIPTYLAVDIIDGYPALDPGHPNEYGARQFGAGIWAWLKHLYAERNASSLAGR
jgi:lysophospholipase L1-like esterase